MLDNLSLIIFEKAWLLWLLLIPASIYLYSLFHKSKSYRSRILRTQTVLLAICITALAEPAIRTEKQVAQVAIAVDLSNSQDLEIARQLYQKALTLTDGLEDVAQISFAADSKIYGLDSKNISFENLLLTKDSLLTNATNLEKTLKEASGLAKNIILISDGQQNRGNVFDSVNTLEAKVFPLVPEQLPESDNQGLKILSLEHPLIVDSKKSAEINIGLFNSSTKLQKAILKVYEDDKEIYSKPVEVAANQGLAVKTSSDPEKTGIRKIKAILQTDASAQEKVSFLSSKSAEKILLLNGSTEDGRLLAQAFENRSYQLVNSVESGQLEQIKDFSVIVLNNIANKQLPEGLLSNLSEYVKKGSSLVVIGGNRAFGLGGYIGTALEDLLPVELIPPKGQEKRLTVAVSLIIDKSRSMADAQKLDFAKEAAREVVKNLKDEDFIGVIGFDSSPFEVVRMGQLAQIRSQAMERIGRLFPAQKTNLFPALDEGRRRLMSVQTGRKHMIVLTDGKIPDADQSYLELVNEMRINGITLSTVLVGTDYDFGFLKKMAEKGGGAFYQTSDPSSLPRIFLQDVKVRSGEQSLKEQSNYYVELGDSGLHSTEIQSYPDLLGFVENKVKKNALHELNVKSNDGTFPLLSSWDVGAGKVISFTSDANGRWSRPWASWSKFTNFWTDILDSARKDTQNENLKYDLRTEVEGNQLVLNLATFEETQGQLDLSLEDETGQKRKLSFNKVRNGSYRAKVTIEPKAATYTFAGKVGKQNLTPVSFAIDSDQFSEATGQGFNIKLLSELAQQTNARINPSKQDLVSSSSNKSVTKSITNEVLIFGLLFYFISILIREILERPLRRVYNLSI